MRQRPYPLAFALPMVNGQPNSAPSSVTASCTKRLHVLRHSPAQRAKHLQRCRWPPQSSARRLQKAPQSSSPCLIPQEHCWPCCGNTVQSPAQNLRLQNHRHPVEHAQTVPYPVLAPCPAPLPTPPKWPAGQHLRRWEAAATGAQPPQHSVAPPPPCVCAPPPLPAFAPPPPLSDGAPPPRQASAVALSLAQKLFAPPPSASSRPPPHASVLQPRLASVSAPQPSSAKPPPPAASEQPPLHGGPLLQA
mmetsp:Transcript_45717/g.141311  ORF Transcript_45717/g.141311 Transcript_45717/m.141311 type:complete len:248 (-) Transcript_45717:1562-2305(-)